MTIQVNITFFALGIVLMIIGMGDLNSSELWNIWLQHTLQVLVGIVLVLGSFHFKKED